MAGRSAGSLDVLVLVVGRGWGSAGLVDLGDIRPYAADDEEAEG